MADVKTDEEKLNAIAVTAPKPILAGGNRVSAIVPRDFEGCYRLANVIQASGLAPKSFKTVEQITVAMMHGMEVGLTPMAALQSIAVINGMPTIYGDGMLALVRASGLMEGIVEELERDDNGAVLMAVCKVKRAGEAAWTVRGFTWAEAMKAGLTRKEGPWTQYPQRMMQMRARSWALRDAFADVLRGLQQTEEALDMIEVGNGTVAPPEPTRAQFRQPAKPENVTEAADTASDPAAGKAAATSAETPHDPETGEVTQSDQPAAKTWKIAQNIVGQDARLKAILALLTTPDLTPADVDDIEAEHKEFLDKLGSAKGGDARRRFADCKLAIEQAQ